MSKPTVAILGASADRSKFGYKSVRAHQDHGFDVYPVNPKGGEIAGLTVYTSLSEVPVESLDRVSMYLPAAVGRRVLGEIVEKGCGEIWFNPGTEDAELLDEARQLGLNVIAGCSIVALGASPADYD